MSNKENKMFDKKPFGIFKKDFVRDPDIDGRKILVLSYILMNANLNGRVGTTLEDLVCDIGYTPNRQCGMINKFIIRYLKKLESEEYIFITKDSDSITQKGFMKIQINRKKNIFDMKGEPHISLSEREYNKITKSEVSVNRATLVKVFLNIKSYMNFSKDHAAIAYPSRKTISEACGNLALQTVDNAIDELIRLKLLYEHVTGKYKTTGGAVRNAVNVYAVSPDQLKYAKAEIMDYYSKRKDVDMDSFTVQ